LDLDFKKIQTTFTKRMDLGWKSNPIIWIWNGCGLDH